MLRQLRRDTEVCKSGAEFVSKILHWARREKCKVRTFPCFACSTLKLPWLWDSRWSANSRSLGVLDAKTLSKAVSELSESGTRLVENRAAQYPTQLKLLNLVNLFKLRLAELQEAEEAVPGPRPQLSECPLGGTDWKSYFWNFQNGTAVFSALPFKVDNFRWQGQLHKLSPLRTKQRISPAHISAHTRKGYHYKDIVFSFERDLAWLRHSYRLARGSSC